MPISRNASVFSAVTVAALSQVVAPDAAAAATPLYEVGYSVPSVAGSANADAKVRITTECNEGSNPNATFNVVTTVTQLDNLAAGVRVATLPCGADTTLTVHSALAPVTVFQADHQASESVAAAVQESGVTFDSDVFTGEVVFAQDECGDTTITGSFGLG